MKQAIATGWDCPRAKVLVKLRDNMEEDFEIQTIGRIRRMPERTHYGIDNLDYCYLYTLDSKYVESVRQSTTNLFEIRQCNLKDECKDFKLIKELKHTNGGDIDPKIALDSIKNYYIKKYELSGNLSDNSKKLQEAGYEMSEQVIKTVKTGSFSTFSDLRDDDPLKETEIYFDVNTSGRDGLSLMNSCAHVSAACGMKSDIGAKILRRLFKKKEGFTGKLLSLPIKNFYAFIINNEDKLKEDFKDAAAQLAIQVTLHLDPIVEDFKIPENEKIKYDPTERNSNPLNKNVYTGYTQQMLSGNLRWKSERMLEKYCERDSVKWIYKNGDNGIQYFSIVYCDSFGKEWSFYPDYIIKLTDGTTVIIETKGGENKDGESQNIDKKSLNKFESFKEYAAKHPDIKWGFVRNYNDNLYFNNTEWVDSMNDEKWQPIEDLF